MPQGYGFITPNTSIGQFNPLQFMIDQSLSRVRTALLCRVVALGTSPGTVNVQPLVSMVDGQGTATDHGTVFGVPYVTLRGGASAIVLVPAPGDIGLMLVCDRDISAAKASPAVGPPPSGREFDLSDSVYLGGLLAATPPTNSITINADGVAIADANGNSIAMGVGGITITGSTVTINGIDFSTHIHSAVKTGTDVSGPPV